MDEEQGGGAPKWMLTYSDTITLLLTFFVMLLTFSTPEPEHFKKFASGLLPGKGSPTGGVLNVSPDNTSRVEEARRLLAGRLARAGAEKPPIYSPIDMARKYPEDVDISALPEIEGAYSILVRLNALFDSGGNLTDRGRKILTDVAAVMNAKRYRFAVRPVGKTEKLSMRMGLEIIRFLRKRVGSCDDWRISYDMILARPVPRRGECSIVLFET